MNKKLFEYELGINQTLNEICAPLFANTPIVCFSHLQFRNNTDYIHMCNDLRVSEITSTASSNAHFFQEFLRKAIQESTHNMSCMWPNDPQNDPVMGKIKEYGIWNGMTMFKYDGSTIHAWAFAGKDDSPDLHNFFNQNHPLFWHFINYFNEKYQLAFKNKEFIAQYDVPMNVFEQEKEVQSVNPIFNLPVKKIRIVHDHKTSYITMKEWQLIVFIAQGLSAKEIAVKSNLSTRTVENRIQNLKMKLDISLKSHFVKIWNENK